MLRVEAAALPSLQEPCQPGQLPKPQAQRASCMQVFEKMSQMFPQMAGGAPDFTGGGGGAPASGGPAFPDGSPPFPGPAHGAPQSVPSVVPPSNTQDPPTSSTPAPGPNGSPVPASGDLVNAALDNKAASKGGDEPLPTTGSNPNPIGPVPPTPPS